MDLFFGTFLPSFGELRTCELPRIPLPRSWVDKPAADVVEPAGWHHDDVTRPKNVSWQRGGNCRGVGGREQGASPPSHGGSVETGCPGRSRRDADSRLRRSQPASRSSLKSGGIQAVSRRILCRLLLR